jgi:hypothetical protein
MELVAGPFIRQVFIHKALKTSQWVVSSKEFLCSPEELITWRESDRCSVLELAFLLRHFLNFRDKVCWWVVFGFGLLGTAPCDDSGQAW